jgi:hypothetical protein
MGQKATFHRLLSVKIMLHLDYGIGQHFGGICNLDDIWGVL